MTTTGAPGRLPPPPPHPIAMVAFHSAADVNAVPLLAHFLDHYLTLGVSPSDFHLVLQAPAAAAAHINATLESMRALAGERVSGALQLWVGRIYEPADV